MAQTLSQTQIIRSLGEALEWFEKEIAWGVSPGELGHLTGRIGELYAAMITRGQMALATNQRGYDVVSANGEHISVKTVTTSSHVEFRASTFDVVDRVIVLRLAVEEGEVSIEELLDCPAGDICSQEPNAAGKFTFYTGRSAAGGAPRAGWAAEDIQKLKVTASAWHGGHQILQYENGSVLVETGGNLEAAAMPVLRRIAREAGVDILNSAGGKKNTRTLGADLIKALE